MRFGRVSQCGRGIALNVYAGLVSAAVVWGSPVAGAQAAPDDAVSQVAARIDKFVADHWEANQATPAAPADDATFLRRATLDLAGRIPTPHEIRQFLADRTPEKRGRTIAALVSGPEFPLHMGNVLDDLIQGRLAGDAAFVDYLRDSFRQHKTWDVFFRDLMVGPWDNDSTRPAMKYLAKRAKDYEALSAEAARTFFGVDVTCAKCHDHPLVDDWKQQHFYGLASFFNRTFEADRQKGIVGEKDAGEVNFLAADGTETTARLMFLSGRIVEETAPPDEALGSSKEVQEKRKPVSRRELLVRAALEDPVFFRRAIVNRMWEYFFGRGLVDPVDQMHSDNSPSVPGLLEWLADDFAASGYDLSRLAKAIASTRVYQLDSRWTQDGPLPDSGLFAVARLRPLSPRQLAFSLVEATGAGWPEAEEAPARVERYQSLEIFAKSLIPSLDPRTAEFQSSIAEALFVSNHSAIQDLLRADRETPGLVAQLVKMKDPRKLVKTAVLATLSRQLRADELTRLSQWISARPFDERAAACGQLVWALAASAEFRFNH